MSILDSFESFFERWIFRALVLVNILAAGTSTCLVIEAWRHLS